MRPADRRTRNNLGLVNSDWGLLLKSQISNPKSKIEMALAGLEPATSGLEDLRSKSIELQSRKIFGEGERTRTSNLFIRNELR